MIHIQFSDPFTFLGIADVYTSIYPATRGKHATTVTYRYDACATVPLLIILLVIFLLDLV